MIKDFYRVFSIIILIFTFQIEQNLFAELSDPLMSPNSLMSKLPDDYEPSDFYKPEEILREFGLFQDAVDFSIWVTRMTNGLGFPGVIEWDVDRNARESEISKALFSNLMGKTYFGKNSKNDFYFDLVDFDNRREAYNGHVYNKIRTIKGLEVRSAEYLKYARNIGRLCFKKLSSLNKDIKLRSLSKRYALNWAQRGHIIWEYMRLLRVRDPHINSDLHIFYPDVDKILESFKILKHQGESRETLEYVLIEVLELSGIGSFVIREDLNKRDLFSADTDDFKKLFEFAIAWWKDSSYSENSKLALYSFMEKLILTHYLPFQNIARNHHFSSELSQARIKNWITMQEAFNKSNKNSLEYYYLSQLEDLTINKLHFNQTEDGLLKEAYVSYTSRTGLCQQLF